MKKPRSLEYCQRNACCTATALMKLIALQFWAGVVWTLLRVAVALCERQPQEMDPESNHPAIQCAEIHNTAGEMHLASYKYSMHQRG